MNRKGTSDDFASADIVLTGESPTIQFISNNKDKADPGYNCRYVQSLALDDLIHTP